MDNRVTANMRNWDERVPDHVVAYDAETFADDPQAVGVEVEAEVLAPHLPGGSFEGLDVVHLQCHIGTDTISLARRGARVVGTDLSGEAITTARRLAARTGLPDVSFAQTANEDAPDVLGREFDVVITSVGVLTWLADLRPWARAVARLLRPGGVFLVHDAHPTMSAVQYDRDDDLLVLGEPYFSGGGPRRYDDGTTYASDTRMENAVTYQWTHDLGEVLSAVLTAGMRIEAFHEHRSIPWKALPFLVRGDRGWELPQGSAQCPLMFSLVARRV